MLHFLWYVSNARRSDAVISSISENHAGIKGCRSVCLAAVVVSCLSRAFLAIAKQRRGSIARTFGFASASQTFLSIRSNEYFLAAPRTARTSVRLSRDGSSD